VYAIEKNPELCMILHEKGYKILDNDFLEYKKDTDFNAIIMNPPFSNGDEHFLKAWEMIDNGTIVCLLNAETINNPFSEKRKLIKKIIEDNGGTVENL
jgi:tRNA1(Val) A37 N6-methylase TrmN6